MKPTLTLKPTNSLTLTPQLQHALKLLTLSTLELNKEIERMVQENPMLELDEHSDDSRSEFQQPVDSNLPDLADDAANADLPDPVAIIGNDEPLDTFADSYEDSGNVYQQPLLNSHGTDSSDLEFSRFAIKPISLCEHLLTQLSM